MATKTKAAKSDVIAAIESAWAKTPRPPDGGISYNQELDEDRAELEAALRGRHWREVPRDILFAWRMDLPGLSPAGFRYYLPAYLLAGLEDAEIANFVLYHFEVLIKRGELGETLSSFSADEREAVRVFFRHMGEKSPEVFQPKDWLAVAGAIPEVD